MSEEVRPPSEDRCAECGTAVDDSWLSYRLDPGNPEKLNHHFGGRSFYDNLKRPPVRKASRQNEEAADGATTQKKNCTSSCSAS